MDFKLVSPYKPTGDQPEAIKQLTEGIKSGAAAQTLLGVTGSGKTFTIANVIKNIGKPTLVLSHNKTLAAQLYSEFKSFFPENADDTTITSFLPESSDDVADSRSLSISSLMAKSFSIYVSVDGIYASG